MIQTQSSSQTMSIASQLSPRDEGRLDLSTLPPVFVSLSNFDKDVAESLEDRLLEHGAKLTYDMSEVRLVLTNVERKRRAMFDLRGQGLALQECAMSSPTSTHHGWHPAKRRRIDDMAAARKGDGVEDSSTASETDDDDDDDETHQGGPVRSVKSEEELLLKWLSSSSIKVIRSIWMEKCFSARKLEPPGDMLLLEGMKVTTPLDAPPTPVTPVNRTREASFGIRRPAEFSSPEAIVARAKADNQETSPRRDRDFGSRRFGDKKGDTSSAPYAAGAPSQRPTHLLHETTSEHEGDKVNVALPPQPEWVSKHVIYACQRPTPDLDVNAAFLDLLKDIRLARLLTADDIGVRAYSSSIASIAAYPYKLSSEREVLNLPGCDVKIARLWTEYAETGSLTAAESAKDDPHLTILRTFYDIWGVGATTAREFYYEKGWRDLDDIVEFGWSTLSRVQQIGVKYYDEFKALIPRSEVETIASIIHSHAVKVRDNRITSMLVGGYRRGKTESGDVDLIISHPDESATANLVTDIVSSLEEEGWITHTLLLALTSTHRDQQTLPFRASRGQHGAGFDTLDKALVVWQDPSWPSRERDLAANPDAKNPAPHRRVDIIVSPWRTVGCAVAGWSGGTTFQRDLRRYAKKVKGWKFDSSGVRDRGGGMVVDVEGYYEGLARREVEGVDEGRGVVGLGKWRGRARTMEEAERRVFEAFELEWRPPWERCTG